MEILRNISIRNGWQSSRSQLASPDSLCDRVVKTNQINVGHALMSAGIVLLEIPYNVLLQRIGAQKWLSAQIVTWGLVAALQSFMTNYRSYLVTRAFLGLCEAGFIPGALYTMSTWYKMPESNLRISLYVLGNPLAAAITSLIGAGILSLGDRRNATS
ncbi:hypothetical protein DL770_008398 [Monosporascus sp. CRB-9-2]|nr:hypothetical protein DL770_008398 [Monosporascus sp. CRB-9-2]